jgi:hypothetical protein
MTMSERDEQQTQPSGDERRTTSQSDERSREEPAAATRPAPTAGQFFGAMWLYTALRFGLFFALFGLLWLVGVKGFLGAVIALVLSVPLSFVLLAKPRAAFAAVLEQRVNARRARQAELDAELRGDDDAS